MKALQELREQVAEELQQAKERREQQDAELLQALKDEMAATLGEALLDELQAEFQVYDRRCQVRFQYRDNVSKWYSGNVSYSLPPLTTSIVSWMDDVDQKIADRERARDTKRQELLEKFSLENQEAMQVNRWHLQFLQLFGLSQYVRKRKIVQ